jgi:hypothetical protein
VYGRPTERVEQAPVVPGVLQDIAALTPAERAALLQEFTAGKRLRLVDRDGEPGPLA